MTEQEIEKLAIKFEDFGFGQVDKQGLTTHGFSPEGLSAFVNAVVNEERKAFHLIVETLDAQQQAANSETHASEKLEAPAWDHVDEVLRVIESARAGKWSWLNNTLCKYIELRIDMRDGGCILKNRHGIRINITDLKKQAHPQQWLPWAKSKTSRI